MSSWFNLELDTTPPVIEISAPVSAPRNTIIEIILTSEEALGTFQEIYTIDSKGIRRDYIFNKINDNILIGYISLRNYSVGFTTLNVTLDDEVLNKGTPTPVIINVLNNVSYSAEVFEIIRSPVAKLSPVQLDIVANFKEGFVLNDLISREINFILINRTPLTKAVKL